MVKRTLVVCVLSVVLVSPALAKVESGIYPGGPKPTSSARSVLDEGVPVEKAKMPSAQVKNRSQEVKEELKAAIEKKRGEFKNVLEQKQTEVREKIEAKKTEFKQNLTKIKDERKKKIVETVSDQLNVLNEKRLKNFSSVLEKLDAVLLKILNRADKIETQGKDAASSREAVTDAKNAIAASRAAIETQAGKVYGIAITTDAALRNNAVVARKNLHDDLVKVQIAVKSAHEATRKAVAVMADILKNGSAVNTNSTQ